MNKRTIGILILGGAGLLFLLTRKGSAAVNKPLPGTGGGGSINREPSGALWAGSTLVGAIANPEAAIPEIAKGGIDGIVKGITNVINTFIQPNQSKMLINGVWVDRPLSRSILQQPTTRG